MDCIHELDYLQHLFGSAKYVSADLSKLSNLKIETEDYAHLSVTHDSGIKSEIHLDYLQQVKQRGCEIIGTEGTVIWRSEGKNPEHCVIRVFEQNTQSWTTLLDTKDLDGNLCYIKLIEAFIKTIEGEKDERLATAEEGLSALKLVMAAKKSSKAGTRIEMDTV